jgi:pimeloyl-ACP methyl ester carboxylesterase
MMVPRRGYADGPFGQVHFQSLGDGAPLILLHQAPQTSGQFDRVYALLAARGLRVIGIDMPGFGQSDPTPETPSIADYAEVVPAVLDHLAIDRAALLGHHTGALAATEASLRWPDRVAALVVNGPLPITAQERADYLATGHQWELGFVPRPGGTHFTELFAIREEFAAGSVPAAWISDYVVQAFSGRGAFWYGHHAAFQYDHHAALARVTHRTLILTNSGDMIYDLAQRTRAQRPDFAYAELAGGGVDIVDQQPEAWSRIVADFVLAA